MITVSPERLLKAVADDTWRYLNLEWSLVSWLVWVCWRVPLSGAERTVDVALNAAEWESGRTWKLDLCQSPVYTLRYLRLFPWPWGGEGQRPCLAAWLMASGAAGMFRIFLAPYGSLQSPMAETRHCSWGPGIDYLGSVRLVLCGGSGKPENSWWETEFFLEQ